MANEQKAYVSAQAAVDDLRPGWRIVGQRPYYVTEPDPNAAANEPQTKAFQRGFIYSILGPKGEPDEVTLGNSDKSVVWNTEPGAPLPAATVVIKGPSRDLSASSNKPSDTTKWVTVYRTPGDPSSGVVGQWDPVNNELHAVAAEPGAKPSGVFINVKVPNADGTTRLVGMVDEGDKSFHPVSADPSTQKRTVQTPTAVYSVDDNDNVKKLFDVDKSVPFQAVNIDGVLYRFDPNEKDPAKSLVKVGPGNQMPNKIEQGGVVYVLTDQPDGTQKYVVAPGVPSPRTMTGAGTQSKYLITYDATTGEELSRKDNPNYQPPQAQVPQVNTAARQILIADPDKPGALKTIDNPSFMTASQALQNLASQLSGQVVDGHIGIDEAKALIDAANSQMATAATAANTVLDYTAQTAQTGAGLLNQRVSSAQGMLQNVLGLAGQGSRSGNYGGGLLSAPAGLGGQLVSGIQGWTADLMGGQGTLDAAARMVQAADPKSDMASPQMQTAVGALTQMLDRYKTLSGGDHPIVQANTAARRSQQQGGLVPPVTAQPQQPQVTGAALGAVSQPFGPGFQAPQATGSFGNTGFVAPPAPTIVINAGPQPMATSNLAPLQRGPLFG